METISIGLSSLTTSRIGLGTWAIGGWMWGVRTRRPRSRRFALETLRNALAQYRAG
jgi:aryl-alcohol dehydrogenase-like predicted oxidoreductase